MYITRIGYTYYRGTEQHHTRAPFLILLQDEAATGRRPQLRAVVRKVALSQCGHWMMGSAQIGRTRVLLSGTYGADGLPKTVASDVFVRGVVLPDTLAEQYWSSDGHNSAGSEASAMRAWAQANLNVLSARRR